MIVWLGQNFLRNKNLINISNLKNNIDLIKDSDNSYALYIMDLYNEYNKFIKRNNNPKFIVDNFKNIKKMKAIEEVNDNTIILSPSHDNSYFVLKKLNSNKEKNIIVICFDMHCDCYNYDNDLWKGNVFSKLLFEGIINKLLIIGVPKEKKDQTLNDIDNRVKDKIILCDFNNVKCILEKDKTSEIYVSIDLDCLDTRKSKYTALEYTSFNILSKFSEKKIINFSNINIKDYIFIKNKLGYTNLYKAGDDGLSIKLLLKYIAEIQSMCKKLNHNYGIKYKNNIFYGEITEINGYDYGNLTNMIVMRIIDKLWIKEVI